MTDLTDALLIFDLIIFGVALATVLWGSFLIADRPKCWFKYVPILALSAHTLIFYGFAAVQRINDVPIGDLGTTIWSSILRLHGVITIIVVLYIFSLESDSNDRHTS